MGVLFRKVLRPSSDLTEDVNCAAGCAGAHWSVLIKCKTWECSLRCYAGCEWQHTWTESPDQTQHPIWPSAWAWRCVCAPLGASICGPKEAGTPALFLKMWWTLNLIHNKLMQFDTERHIKGNVNFSTFVFKVLVPKTRWMEEFVSIWLQTKESNDFLLVSLYLHSLKIHEKFYVSEL